MTPASNPQALPESTSSLGFADGFGLRQRSRETTGGDLVETLRLHDALVAAAGFDFALRERVGRLANFRHAYYARARRVDRLDGTTLALVGDTVEGARLSQILAVAQAFDLDLDVNAALCLLRQIVPAVAMLHQNARDVSHGALAPERILVTPNARVVLVEYVLGAAIESLAYSRERLWKDLRVAVPPGAGPARLNHRADVMQIGVVALALVLGRPLGDDDLRDLPSLLASATENSVMGGREPISDSLRRWLSRALQLDAGGAFESALEAQLALDDVLSGDAGYIAAPVALESFLTRYNECALKMAQWPVIAPIPPETPEAPKEPEARPASEAVSAPVVLAPAPPKVLPPSPKLGVARVSADAPAVPSFRAIATEPKTPSLPVAPVAAAVEPPPAALAIEELPEPEAPFDEAALRAQFLAVAGPTGDPTPGRVPAWWRTAALLFAVVAASEGGFIAWRLANSPSGLLGTNGTLKVESKPMGAQVKIDGELRGITPLSLSIAGGAHVMEIAAGTEPRVIPISVIAGQTLAQYVELVGVSALGRLSIQSSPVGATVLLDGQPRGVTPLELPDVSAGQHELVLDLKGQRVRQTVSVATGITTTVDLPVTAVPIDAAGMFPAAVTTTGSLLVQAPFEMKVFEGDALLGVTGSRLTLPPGPHTLEIVSETLSFRTPTSVEIVAGKTSRLPVKLPKGTAHLNATPWAEVWVDGEKVGETPLGNLALTIGPHEIVFKHPELGEQAHAATVTAAAPLRLSANLNKPQ
jgi:hypothetical protein